MTNKKIYILYGLVAFFSTALFAYILFPDEPIKQHITTTFARQYPDYRLTIGTVRVALPLGMGLGETRVDLDEKNILAAEKVTLGYGLMSFFKANARLKIKAKAYDGTISSTVDLAKDGFRVVRADTKFSGIQTGMMESVKDMSGGRFSGSLYGDIVYDKKKSKDPVVFDLQMKDCTIPVKMSFVNLGDLDFKDVTLKGTMTGRNLEIAEGKLRGLQTDGEITGRIILNDIFSRIRLNLSGTAQPHHAFVKTLPPNMMQANLMGKKGLSFQVTGTMEAPIFSLR